MKISTIGDVFKVSSGGTPSRKNADYFNGGNIPWIKTGDLKGKYVGVPSERITKEGLERSSAKLFPAKTVLLAMYGATIGNCSILPYEAATNQACAALLPSENCNEAYLYYYLKSIKNSLIFMGVGGAQPNISASLIKRVKIPLPSLEEQKQIAAILDAADKLRQKDQQMVEHYTALSQSLFLEMFGDLIKNPMSWDSVKLGDICGVGSSKRVFVSEFVDSGVPFYRGTEVGQLAYGNEIKPHLFISPDKYELLKNESGVPKIGDLLLPSICHDGRILKVKTIDPFYFKDGRVLWIKVNSDLINSDYLRYFLKGLFLTNYSNYASGTTFAELKIVSLKSIRVFNPPIEIQNQFAKRIAIIEQQKQQAQKNLEKSEILFNSLLQRAFTGELTANKAA